MQRKVNWLMVLFSLIGGAIGFILSEWFLHSYLDRMPRIFLMGIYFGIISLMIGIFCLLAEVISPKLNGASWRQRYTDVSWKLLVPATLVVMFIGGLAAEALYQLDFNGAKTVKDVVVVIDNSGSMQGTDPQNLRYQAVKNMVDSMDKDMRVGIVQFSDEASVALPLTVLNPASKQQVHQTMDTMVTTDGGTDFTLALNTAMQMIQEQNDDTRGTVVIMLSDGDSTLDSNTLQPFQQQGIAIHTIGLSLQNGVNPNLLPEIASQTGGQYYDVSQATDLPKTFQQIYDTLDKRTLVTERSEPFNSNLYYQILHVVLIMILGALLGVGLGLLFDNRFLARSFGIGGGVGGLLAGLLLEWGIGKTDWTDGVIRFLAIMILALVIALFTLVIPIGENNKRMIRRNDTPPPPTSSGSPRRRRGESARSFQR
ncbi:vWA domain-containing protein [Paenibacillus wulumuqiensis]|uniref:vWA domain-containing protein n=1 Tax=Paenibacillus wulumuqiensis TaxID=1567107 RepID=UPI000619EC0B|nr:vWA domain-containing protein [Paenibacillus wulumuqiensis]